MRVRLLAPAAVLVLTAGCSAGSPPAAAPTTAPSPTGAASATPAAPEEPAERLIEVTYAGGEVRTAEPRVALVLGETVLLRVTSDVPEQIHVHGYDLLLDLVPGTAADLRFTADKPGAYEVELHDARRPLLQLRVA